MSNNGRYSQIYTKIWNDEKFRQLSPEAQRLYFYVLTSPHSNMAGFYLLPKPYIERDMVTLPKGLDKPFDELLDKGLIKYDEGANMILIPNYFRYNPLNNKNQKKGANNRVRELPENTLIDEFRAICEQYYPDSLETLTKGLAKGHETNEGIQNTETEDRKQKTELTTKISEVIDFYSEQAQKTDNLVDHTKSVLQDGRKCVRARLKDGFDVQQCKDAILGAIEAIESDKSWWTSQRDLEGIFKTKSGKYVEGFSKWHNGDLVNSGLLKDSEDHETKSPSKTREIVDYTPSKKKQEANNEK